MLMLIWCGFIFMGGGEKRFPCDENPKLEIKDTPRKTTKWLKYDDGIVSLYYPQHLEWNVGPALPEWIRCVRVWQEIEWFSYFDGGLLDANLLLTETTWTRRVCTSVFTWEFTHTHTLLTPTTSHTHIDTISLP